MLHDDNKHHPVSSLGFACFKPQNFLDKSVLRFKTYSDRDFSMN